MHPASRPLQLAPPNPAPTALAARSLQARQVRSRRGAQLPPPYRQPEQQRSAELESFLSQFSAARTETGHAAVVRNGHHPARPVQTGIGPMSVRIPKVRSRTGEPVTFRSALVPPYMRKTRTLEAALPWLYLKGIRRRVVNRKLHGQIIRPPAGGGLVHQRNLDLCACRSAGIGKAEIAFRAHGLATKMP